MLVVQLGLTPTAKKMTRPLRLIGSDDRDFQLRRRFDRALQRDGGCTRTLSNGDAVPQTASDAECGTTPAPASLKAS